MELTNDVGINDDDANGKSGWGPQQQRHHGDQ
jgi:hypothetical protein